MTDSTRVRSLLAHPAFGWLLVATPLVGYAAGEIGLGLLLLLALVLALGMHRSLRPPVNGRRRRREPRLLRTPVQVALAVFVAVGLGGLIAVVASLLLAAAAPSLVGDGSLLVKVLLVVFVLGPCIAIGYRCGYWWAFTGAAGLVPLLAFCLVVAGPRSWSGVGLVAVALLAVAYAVAAGSLRRELDQQTGSGRRRPAAQPKRRSGPGAVQSAPRRRTTVTSTSRPQRAQGAPGLRESVRQPERRSHEQQR